MADGMQIEVVVLRGEVVEHQHRAGVLSKIVLERQHLTAIAQGRLREQPDLRQTVEDDPLGLQALDLVKDRLDRFAKLQVGGIDDRLLLVRVKAEFRRYQLEYFDAVERPAVRLGHGKQLVPGLRERDVEAPLSLFDPLEEKLHRQSGLAGTGLSFDEMDPVLREAAGENGIKPRHAG